MCKLQCRVFAKFDNKSLTFYSSLIWQQHQPRSWNKAFWWSETKTSISFNKESFSSFQRKHHKSYKCKSSRSNHPLLSIHEWIPFGVGCSLMLSPFMMVQAPVRCAHVLWCPWLSLFWRDFSPLSLPLALNWRTICFYFNIKAFCLWFHDITPASIIVQFDAECT